MKQHGLIPEYKAQKEVPCTWGTPFVPYMAGISVVELERGSRRFGYLTLTLRTTSKSRVLFFTQTLQILQSNFFINVIHHQELAQFNVFVHLMSILPVTGTHNDDWELVFGFTIL